jgi:hypothetical protein
MPSSEWKRNGTPSKDAPSVNPWHCHVIERHALEHTVYKDADSNQSIATAPERASRFPTPGMPRREEAASFCVGVVTAMQEGIGELTAYRS